MRRLSALDVDAYLKQADAKPLILDVREPWEHAVCRINGSELVPMRQIPTALNRLDPDRAKQLLDALPAQEWQAYAEAYSELAARPPG